jgi:nucleoside-diphosphate kinase
VTSLEFSYNTLNMLQQTLIIIKPDGVAGGFTDEIIKRYMAVGLEVVKRKAWEKAPLDIVEKHYPMDPEYLRSIGEKTIAAGQKVKSAEDQGRKVVTWLRKFITSGPIVALVLEGEEAVLTARKTTGFTDPSTAEKGTIRGDLGTDSILKANMEERPVYNLIHASGSAEEAEKEINLWFGNSNLP